MEVYKNLNVVGENIVIPAGDEGSKWNDFIEAVELILNG